MFVLAQALHWVDVDDMHIALWENRSTVRTNKSRSETIFLMLKTFSRDSTFEDFVRTVRRSLEHESELTNRLNMPFSRVSVELLSTAARRCHRFRRRRHTVYVTALAATHPQVAVNSRNFVQLITSLVCFSSFCSCSHEVTFTPSLLPYTCFGTPVPYAVTDLHLCKSLASCLRPHLHAPLLLSLSESRCHIVLPRTIQMIQSVSYSNSRAHSIVWCDSAVASSLPPLSLYAYPSDVSHRATCGRTRIGTNSDEMGC